jgi:membrane protein implicated in regulation of membrane protease activity
MNILPVNFAGLLLIALALAMFILEAKYASHGILGIGGVVAMLLGALMLIRSPLTNAGVSVGVAAGMTLPFAGISIFLMRLVLRSRSWKQSTGLEQLAGLEGQVTEALVSAAPGGPARGMVRPEGHAHPRSQGRWVDFACRTEADFAERRRLMRRGVSIEKEAQNGSDRESDCALCFPDLVLEFPVHHQGMGARRGVASRADAARSEARGVAAGVLAD